jgi:hypothetical protein
MPGESPKAYAAFLTYLNMGSDRSIAAAFFKHRGMPVPEIVGARKAPGGWCQWATKNKWASRAHDFDTYQAMRKARIKASLLEDTYMKFAQEMNNTSDTFIGILRGEVQVNQIRFAALIKALEWCGMETPAQRRAGGLDTPLQATQNNVVVYIPDNGRAVDDV